MSNVRALRMLRAELYWVGGIEPHRLAMAPRPRSGEWLAEEVASWSTAGVSTVVSLLEAHEVRELELKHEQSSCEERGIQFLSYLIPDRGTPTSVSALSPLLEELVSQARSERAILVHCRAGIGRTGLVSGCLLHLLGVPFENIFHILSSARGMVVPDTVAQEEWVRRFARERAL